MLHASKIPGRWLRQGARFEVTASGSAIGTIDAARSTFALGAQSFRITRSGILGPKFQLRSGDTVIATASQKPFRNRYTLAFGGKQWTFKAIVPTATKFGLFENERQTGSIASNPLSNRLKDITADLPDDLPREVQMFPLSLLSAS